MTSFVNCPACGNAVVEFYINSHLDGGCSAFLGSADEEKVKSLTVTGETLAPNGSRVAASLKRKDEAVPTSMKTVETAEDRDSSHIKDERIMPPSKKFKSSNAIEQAKPLADKVRPVVLDDFVGQEQLLGEGGMLRNLIEQDKIGSCLFWGPPGTGKTTIARLIAHKTKSVFKELSATTASTADLRKVFEEATNLLKLTGRKTILFIDEIQRFNKAQQDSFLPVVEAGLISLIASTTENPSFRINGALLSRCRVFVLNKLSPEEVLKILYRALSICNGSSIERTPSLSSLSSSSHSQAPTISPTSSSTNASKSVLDSNVLEKDVIDDDLLQFPAAAADGDARVALSSLELALSVTKGKEDKNGKLTEKPIDQRELKAQLRKAHLQYDRSGDHHYDTISALHKSVRGGDANASLYWLARMLQGGDDPLYIARRLIRMASEDIGLANPLALQSAVAAYQATHLLGMPECDCILAQVVVLLAESPKSVRSYKAYGKAKALVEKEQNYPVPIHLRNAPTRLMKELGFGKGYKYPPDYAHPVTQPYLPPELIGVRLLQDEHSLEEKSVDEPALREWEWKVQAGKPWEGRELLLQHFSSQLNKDTFNKSKVGTND